MEQPTTLLENIGTIVTISVTTFGALTFIFAQIFKSIQAKAYGLPLRITHLNSSDYIGILVTMFLMFSSSLISLITLIFSDLDFKMSHIFILTGSIITLLIIRFFYPNRTSRGKLTILSKSTLILLLVFSIMLATLLYLPASIWHTDTWVINAIYVTTILVMISLRIIITYMMLDQKAIGDNLLTRRGKIALTINMSLDHYQGSSYIISMRHDKDKWILIPYEVEIKKKERQREKIRPDPESASGTFIKFDSSRFIIRSIDGMEIKMIKCTGIIPKDKN